MVDDKELAPTGRAVMLMLLMRHAPELLCLRLHPLRLSSDDPRAMAISNRALAIIAFWLTQVFGGPLLSLTLRGSSDFLTSIRSLMMIVCTVPSSVSNGLVGSQRAMPGK